MGKFCRHCGSQLVECYEFGYDSNTAKPNKGFRCPHWEAEEDANAKEIEEIAQAKYGKAGAQTWTPVINQHDKYQVNISQ